MNIVDKIKMDIERSKHIKMLKEKYARPLMPGEDVGFIDFVIDTEEMMDCSFVYGYDNMYGWYTIRKIVVKAAVENVMSVDDDILKKKKKSAAKKKNKKNKKKREQLEKFEQGFLPVAKLSSGAIITLTKEEFERYNNREKISIVRWVKEEERLVGGGYQVFVEEFDFASYDEDDYDIKIEIAPLFQLTSILKDFPYKVIDFRSSTIITVQNVEEYCSVIRSIATGKPVSVVKNIGNLPRYWTNIAVRALVRFKKKDYIPTMVEVVKEYEIAYSQDELEYAYTRFLPFTGALEKKKNFSFNFGDITRRVEVVEGIMTFKVEIGCTVLKPTFCNWSWHHIVSYYVYYEEDYKLLNFLCWFLPLFFCGDTVTCDKAKIVFREKYVDVKPTCEEIVLFLTRMAVVRVDAGKLLEVLQGSIRADYEYLYSKEGNIDLLIEQARAFAVEIMKIL